MSLCWMVLVGPWTTSCLVPAVSIVFTLVNHPWLRSITHLRRLHYIPALNCEHFCTCYLLLFNLMAGWPSSSGFVALIVLSLQCGIVSWGGQWGVQCWEWFFGHTCPSFFFFQWNYSSAKGLLGFWWIGPFRDFVINWWSNLPRPLQRTMS